MTASFINRIEVGGVRIYELHVPFADGRTGYYKISVDPLKEAIFLKACKEEITADLNDFGTILESCYLPLLVPVLEDGKVNP